MRALLGSKSLQITTPDLEAHHCRLHRDHSLELTPWSQVIIAPIDRLSQDQPTRRERCMMDRSSKHAHRLTDNDRQELQVLVRSGATFETAANAVGCSTKAIQRLMAKTGGIKPSSRPRSPLRLSIAEREAVSRSIATGESCRSIARQLGRSPSTISREIKRNGGRSRYRAWSADRATARRSRRPKTAKLASSHRLRSEVELRLELCWSPQQISARLEIDYPDDPEMRVSHETIYRSLFVQSRGALRKELTRCLRTGRSRRKPRRGKRGGGRLKNMVMISERPALVEDRALPGHWEGDLILGKAGNSAIATLVERQSRFTMLVGLPRGRQATDVEEALAAKILELPDQLRRSLTWDQGKEMARHVRLARETGIQVFFCDPRSPWQRGTNENTNGLLRQYFPRKTEFSSVDDPELNRVADELNGRPRETLDWKTPAEILAQVLL
jgi:IS30 family transposase